MRLKQLAFLLPLLLIGALAAAAAPQLRNVGVVAEGNTTTLTLHASGAYTHNEYRPTDNLLLVDLTGISAGKLHERVRSLNLPGVKSYKVVGYTGAGGVEIARLELTLIARPRVDVRDSKDGVVVRITPSESASSEPENAATSASAAPSTHSADNTAPAAPADVRASQKPLQVRNVAVVRGKDGMEVEVTGDGTLTAKAMRLSAPDRVVLDLPNAVLSGRPRNIRVNSGDLKMVRMGRFQADPPVTRLVLDLDSPRDYEVVESGNKLILKLRPVAAAAAPPVTPAAVPAVASTAAPASPVAPAPAPSTTPAAEVQLAKASAQPAPAASTPASSEREYKGDRQPAQDFVVVEPKFQPKPAEPQKPPAAAAQQESKDVAPLKVSTSEPLKNSALAEPQNATKQVARAEVKPVAPAPIVPAVNLAAEQLQAQQAPPPTTRPRYTGEPISVNLKDVDIKDFFRLIHEISGLNIVLSPGVSGSLTLVLDDVPWDQALDIVLKNNNLDRQLEGNVLRIATVDNLRREAQARRAQVEAQALAVDKVTVTRFLSYAHAAQVLPVVKKQLSQRGDIVADPRTNALVISDIPTTLPNIDALLAQLDRKTQEVEIESRVVAATRNFVRDIGTQLGFGFGNKATAVGGASDVGPSPIQAAPTQPILFIGKPTPTALLPIPLFSNLKAAATSGLSLLNVGSNYRVDAILTMLETRGLIKILSRPRVITQNNAQAIVKQGQRVPVITPGTSTSPPTTTYVDATLRMTVTPQITVEGTIFLNIDIENTTPDFSQRDANGAPTLLTQQTTTQVLVTNGGTVVIGGVIQTSNSVTIDQVPLLGTIPLLGNAFKHRRVSTSTQELIFFISPRIIET
ncbi:MAG: type IV pilus secretin PilQ [Terriglobales bacterium]